MTININERELALILDSLNHYATHNFTRNNDRLAYRLDRLYEYLNATNEPQPTQDQTPTEVTQEFKDFMTWLFKQG